VIVTSAWEAEVQAKWKNSTAKSAAVDFMILEYIFPSLVFTFSVNRLVLFGFRWLSEGQDIVCDLDLVENSTNQACGI